MKLFKNIFLFVTFFCFFFTSCNKNSKHTKHEKHNNEFQNAIAVLQSTEGNEAKGKVIFTKVKEGVKVIATVVNLLPNSQHGFHVHEFGDISGKDGKSTGGHFNPDGHAHKLPETEKMRHAGDMGNLTTDEKGVAIFEKVFDNFSLNPLDKNCIIGRGVIVHLKRDDGTGATGNAGARIAMGVIGIAK